MKLSIVILAAGFGTRMNSNLAKPLHTICGKSLIKIIIENALQLSDDITLILHHQADAIKEHLKDYSNLKYIYQDMQNHKGTGGALINYEPKYEEALILNADMPLITQNSLKIIANTNSKIVLSTFNKYSANSYGRVIKENDKISKIVETKDANNEELKCTLCNAGIYKISKDILKTYIPKLNNNNAQKEYYLTDIIKMAIDDKISVSECTFDEIEFLGINNKLDLEQAEQIMQKRIKDELLINGVIMHNKDSIFIELDTQISNDCEIESGVVIKANSIIKSSKILANSVIENSEIINSSIGPMARIRPKCVIKDSKIGNFVECKNAKLENVKAGHLAYLGDCEISSGVNIGCGVIICNYDGKNKHLSKIGKNVFIGSNSNLIAPINIPSDTLIAAGSTISNKDAAKLKAKDLFIERNKGVIFNNFKDF
ncbi:bifunctional UDP-N-acetylglucosamine diphosphorylase/glucosamine-1-phosphate N-acetyltransferase GlmU [Campylobacter sp. RM9334]|uniref:bifunctional UDP-N-acetylglucosamine diphosphorylase/glucosamine-1-phosphate N-acetyltransferase GlmU n=1 Tax=Campylobacter sp. RM9334 TaxID=2735732 RepID=UPI001DDF4EDB|nr:bifunctional UDP-N-acetylglucosamine diphosphorylase/glucosamine-1-phosphate N-acetyltransferase GlmU [Campylobacter sp. RM9334]